MSNKQQQKDAGTTRSGDIGQVFDEMSDRYTDVMDKMVPHYRTMIKAMLEFLPESFKPDRILDLGCGNGNVSILSRALFPDAQHHLVDASDEMIRLCKARFEGYTLTYERNFFQNLELPPDTYDLVLAGLSLHHLDAEEKQQFFDKLVAALTAKGIFACADLFVNKDSVEHEQHLMDWKTFVFDSGKSQEDWDWLIDHYVKYDYPSMYSDQRIWLLGAGFAQVELSWHDGHWGCFHAHKE